MSISEVEIGEAPIEIIDGDRGSNYPKQNELLEDGHCLFLSAKNVTKNGFEFEENQFISEDKDFALRKGKALRHDVIITTRGTLGNVAWYSDSVAFENIRINSGMVLIRPKNQEILPQYLYTFFRSNKFQNQVQALRSGVAQPQLPIRDLKKIKIPLPNRGTQQSLTKTISNYDNLIENNRRRIALLEESARLLYREWFVHFRFPKNSISKNCQTLPKGWERISAYEIADILSGGTPRTTTEVYWSEEIPFFTPKDAGANWYAYETEKSISEEGLNNCNSKLYPKDTIFITARGTVGKVRLAQRDMAMNQSCYALRSKAKNISHYFLFLSILEGVNQLKQRATGAVFDTIVVDTFKLMELTIPPDDLLFDFNELCEPIFNQISILSKQNNSLAKARDLLLPRLMNGRIAV